MVIRVLKVCVCVCAVLCFVIFPSVLFPSREYSLTILSAEDKEDDLMYLVNLFMLWCWGTSHQISHTQTDQSALEPSSL